MIDKKLFYDVVRDNSGNVVTWRMTNDDKHIVTGVTADGKRVRIVTRNWLHTRQINVFRGTKLLERIRSRRNWSREE